MSVAPDLAPVIAIDGPSASGKGTVAQRVAQRLGYHYLDSGALYRILALAALKAGIGWHAEADLAALADKANIRFDGDRIWLNGVDVSDELRTEQIGKGASEVAVHPAVRQALLGVQYGFRRMPGLVADGRDMATVVFPDAETKIFLTASTQVRAERRYKQLIGKGIHANLADILQDLESRDARDRQRTIAPLQKSADANLLETSELTIDQAVEAILQYQQNTVSS